MMHFTCFDTSGKRRGWVFDDGEIRMSNNTCVDCDAKRSNSRVSGSVLIDCSTDSTQFSKQRGDSGPPIFSIMLC